MVLHVYTDNKKPQQLIKLIGEKPQEIYEYIEEMKKYGYEIIDFPPIEYCRRTVYVNILAADPAATK